MSGLAFVLTLATFAGSDAPRTVTPQTNAPVQLDDVEVLGRRGRALVEPESELDGAQIDALGAYDIGEVLRRLSEDQALGDAPMIIVNGRRMADPAVFNGFPPDALVRVEILPPEAAGLYGAGSPSRRVVNIVLQRQFDSRDGRASLSGPAAGGRIEVGADLRQSSIVENRTRQMGVQVDVDTALRAGDRDLGRTEFPGVDEVTLRPASERVGVNLAQTGALGDWSFSLRTNAQVQDSRSTARLADEIIDSRRRSQSLSVNGGLNGEAAGWSVQTSLGGQLSHGDQSGFSPSESSQQSVSANLALNRRLFDLPAGPVSGNLSGQISRSRSVIETSDARRVSTGRAESFGGNLSIPLIGGGMTSDAARLLGELSASVGATLIQTNSGRGDGVNASLNWSPLQKLRFNANWSGSTRAVSDQQRFEPEYFGEPTMVFDFLTGEAVEVAPLLGGNPDLRSSRQDLMALSVSAGPFTALALQGGVNLQRLEATDGIGVLPDPTPELEAVFPDRFFRDADGRLVSIDRRPFNTGGALSESLTSSLNMRVPFGGAAARDVLRLSLNHSWQLRNTTSLHPALPELDRLSGDGGGQPRHAVGVGFDFRNGPWGVNLGARWRGSYRQRRNIGQDGPDDLRIASISLTDVKISYLFERAIETQGGGVRRGVGFNLELEIANLFDTRPAARLGDGRPAPGYGRDDQDPLGRTIRLVARRRF